MRKKTAKIIIFSVLCLPPLFLRGEIKPGGYFSFEFLKGQSQSASPLGSLQNLQAGFFVKGEITPDFDFVVETRLRTESNLEIEQALVQGKLGRSGSLSAGLFLVPFGKFNESNRPYQTILIRTPLNLEAFYPADWRDIGLCFHIQQKVFNFAGYIGNGLGEKNGAVSGQHFQDINKNKGIGGRVGAVIDEGLEAGLSYYTGRYDKENELRLILAGADLTWVTTDYEVRGEYTKGVWRNPGGSPKGKAQGFFVSLNLNSGRLQPVISFQKWDLGDTSQGLLLQILEGGTDPLAERRRWAFGLRFFLNPSLVIKMEYDVNKEKGPALKNNLLLVQAALNF